eukprot:929903-Pelagomonas_calceolata.AAC.1
MTRALPSRCGSIVKNQTCSEIFTSVLQSECAQKSTMQNSFCSSYSQWGSGGLLAAARAWSRS